MVGDRDGQQARVLGRPAHAPHHLVRTMEYLFERKNAIRTRRKDVDGERADVGESAPVRSEYAV